jgi:hypothetical protein
MRLALVIWGNWIAVERVRFPYSTNQVLPMLLLLISLPFFAVVVLLFVDKTNL